MQKMTHEKTWSVVPSPHVPKYTQLFDNKADFIKLNSGEQFSLSSVRPRDFVVNLILLYTLESCMTQGEPDSGPCSSGAVKVKVSPDQHWDRDKGEFLVGHLTSLSCLPPPHWEKSFTCPVRLLICLNFRVFPIEATEARLSIHNHQEKLCVFPNDQTAFTFQWLSQTICGIGNIY